jgi:hypothetical protein
MEKLKTMRRVLTLLGVLMMPLIIFAQSELTALEYFIDVDPGPGNGTIINITPGINYSGELTVQTDALSPGFHTLYVRFLNDNSGWGLTEARTIYIRADEPALYPAQISKLEYFVDTDPGPGLGQHIPLDTGHDVTIEDIIQTADLEPGFHNLFIRTYTDRSGWGLTEARTIYIRADEPVSTTVPITGLEYFIGDDPGFGEGISIDMEAALDLIVSATIPTADLALGSYTISVRPINQNGTWGFPERSTFVIGNEQRLVTFRVDMTAQFKAGFFNPDNEKVYVRGSFNEFGLTELQRETTSAKQPANQGSNSILSEDQPLIYSEVVDVPGDTGEEILYGYYYAPEDDPENGTWETGVGPDGYRRLTLGEPGETIETEPVYLNDAEPIEEVIFTYGPGWNIIGLPGLINHETYASVYPNTVDNSLYRFNGSYTNVSKLDAGSGYWVRMNGESVLNFTGAGIKKLELNLRQGWNLISGPSIEFPFTSITDTNDILTDGTLFGFNGNYSNVDVLAPGRGYWVRTRSEGSIVMNVDDIQQEKQESKQLDLDNFSVVNLSTGDTPLMPLRFAGTLPQGQTQLNYSMPPLPPAGIADARIEGDYRLSESTEITVILTGTSADLMLSLNAPKRLESDVNEVANTPELTKTSFVNFLLTEFSGDLVANVSTLLPGENLMLMSGTDRFTIQYRNEPLDELPAEFTLDQNYPNPFNPTTTITVRTTGIRRCLPRSLHCPWDKKS